MFVKEVHFYLDHVLSVNELLISIINDIFFIYRTDLLTFIHIPVLNSDYLYTLVINTSANYK